MLQFELSVVIAFTVFARYVVIRSLLT